MTGDIKGYLTVLVKKKNKARDNVVILTVAGSDICSALMCVRKSASQARKCGTRIIKKGKEEERGRESRKREGGRKRERERQVEHTLLEKMVRAPDFLN